MSMIDLKNLDKLNPEQKAQFNALLDQFPHLNSKMETSRELRTPTVLEEEKKFIQPPLQTTEEVDYSNFSTPAPSAPLPKKPKSEIPQIKIDPNSPSAMFSSFEKEDEKPKLTEEEVKEIQEEKKQQRIEAAVAAGQPPEIAKFSDKGKIHPILQKMRATVGLRSVQDPVIVDLGGCKYSMRPLDRSNIAQATVLAATTTTNTLVYETNLEAAIIAFSVVAIDHVPIVDIFSIPTEELAVEEGKPPVRLTHLQREERAARELYLELLRSPNELVEGLGIYYQQEFPPLSLIGKGKSKFLCPAEDCLQSRIADSDSDCYCPVHGEKMAREDLIPSPS